LDCLTLKEGTDRLPETSVRNYHYTLRNKPEERRSHLYRGGSLQSRSVSEPLPLCHIFTTFNILVAVCLWFRLSQFNIYIYMLGMMLVRLGGLLFVVVSVYCYSGRVCNRGLVQTPRLHTQPSWVCMWAANRGVAPEKEGLKQRQINKTQHMNLK
jgi:hypothetical protein